MDEDLRGINHRFEIEAFVREGVTKRHAFYLLISVDAAGRLMMIRGRIKDRADALSAWFEMWTQAVTDCLSLGMSFEQLYKTYRGQNFEPSGTVRGAAQISKCVSPVDYIMQWLTLHFDEYGILRK